MVKIAVSLLAVVFVYGVALTVQAKRTDSSPVSSQVIAQIDQALQTDLKDSRPGQLTVPEIAEAHRLLNLCQPLPEVTEKRLWLRVNSNKSEKAGGFFETSLLKRIEARSLLELHEQVKSGECAKQLKSRLDHLELELKTLKQAFADHIKKDQP